MLVGVAPHAAVSEGGSVGVFSSDTFTPAYIPCAWSCASVSPKLCSGNGHGKAKVSTRPGAQATIQPNSRPLNRIPPGDDVGGKEQQLYLLKSGVLRCSHSLRQH